MTEPASRSLVPFTDSGREKALRDWCERENLDSDNRDAPHVQAFLAGFDDGHDCGWDGALVWARRNVERTGSVDVCR